MYEELPRKMVEWILNHPQSRKPVLLPAIAAISVCEHYLGTCFLDSNSPLLKHKPNFIGDTSREFGPRLVQIASSVFALRNEPGFLEICRRLATRPLVAVFYEANAAYHLQEFGFRISARPETLSKGEDFDFSISFGETVANVEATALSGKKFGANNIRNALSKKRKQVPDDKPAIIICFVPGFWRDNTPNIENELEKLSHDFLRGTRRINYLFFLEDIIHISTGSRTMTRCFYYKNLNPRMNDPILDSIIAANKMTDAQTHAILQNGAQNSFAGTGAFANWLIWLNQRLH